MKSDVTTHRPLSRNTTARILKEFKEKRTANTREAHLIKSLRMDTKLGYNMVVGAPWSTGKDTHRKHTLNTLHILHYLFLPHCTTPPDGASISAASQSFLYTLIMKEPPLPCGPGGPHHHVIPCLRIRPQQLYERGFARICWAFVLALLQDPGREIATGRPVRDHVRFHAARRFAAVRLQAHSEVLALAYIHPPIWNTRDAIRVYSLASIVAHDTSLCNIYEHARLCTELLHTCDEELERSRRGVHEEHVICILQVPNACGAKQEARGWTVAPV